MNPERALAQADPIQSVRVHALDILDRVVHAAADAELPSPSDVLKVCRRKLQENRYTVLVAGEAKRGKSTFINAILGRDLLPTDVDIATCQVFRIQQAEQEAYRIRFEDGSAQEITEKDLPRFGSQVLADAGALPRLDQLIRWIEVEGPIHFLPREITLMDTPGLGSVYASHGRIVQRFVPEADAVIFVLHSDSPISREEIAFLDKILGVTQNVLFVQTMIDRYKREHWQAIQARNEQVLAEQFRDRLTDKRIWPVSSINLLKAAQTGDQDYEQVSRFHPLASALHAFLFRAAGWGRAAEVLPIAQASHQAASSILSARRASLLDVTPQRSNQSQQLEEALRQFEKQWGEGGRQREELLASLRQVANDQRREFWRSLQPGCKLEVELQEKIDAVGSLDQARQLATGLSAQVAEAAIDQWRKITARFQSECLKLLEPFVQATEFISATSDPSSFRPVVRSGRGIDLGDDPSFKMIVAANDFVEGTAIATGVILTVVVTTGWFPPVAVVGAIATGIWYAVRGWKLAGAAQIEAARASLHKHLGEVFQQVRRHFFEGDAATGCLGVADHYIDSQVRHLTWQVNSLATQKQDEGRAELTRLLETARLDEQQRKEKAEQIQRQRVEWDTLSQSIQEVQQQLHQWEQKLDMTHGI